MTTDKNGRRKLPFPDVNMPTYNTCLSSFTYSNYSYFSTKDKFVCVISMIALKNSLSTYPVESYYLIQ